MSFKKRLFIGAGALTTVAAATTLVAGVTFGFFSASTSSTASTFTSGTVSIGSPAVTDTNCVITNMVPGDSSSGYGSGSGADAQCVFSVKYTGSAPAYIGLGTTLSGSLTLASALQWKITDGGAHTYTTSGAINTNAVGDPLYVAADNGTVATGQKTYTFTVDYLLPSSVTDQTLTTASLGLTVYAVQSGNNGTGAACTVGAECTTGPTGIPNWS